MRRIGVILATLCCVMALAQQASAQTLEVGWGFGVAAGIERSETLGAKEVRRARSRLVFPFDFRVDEEPREGLGLVAFVEVEPHVSLGGEVRYMRWFWPNIVGFVGATGVVAPQSLAGLNFGFQAHLPLGKGTSLFLEPSFAVLPIGTDLPDNRLLLWGLVCLGLHVK